MKRSIAMLFVVIMILSCMPVMANTVPGESAVTTAAAKKTKKVSVKNGWVKSGSTFKYYVNGKYRKNGIFTIDGVNYAFDSKGKMQTGWVTFSKKKYYASKNQGAKGKGAILTGYRKIGNSYYYLDPAKKGVVTKGFVMLNGKKYYFDSETGKQRRTPGWFFTGNYMYYILADGSIATNCTIGGYTIGPDGAVADAYGYDRKAQGYSSRTRYMILVDKSRHLVNFYQGSKGHWVNIRRNMPCTVGKKSTPTRSGNFMLSLKVTKNGKYGRKDFKASTAFYAFRINSGNFFHSILYKLGCTNPYKSKPKDAALGKNKSNSCIRLRLEDAKFIWDNMTRYTRTVVY